MNEGALVGSAEKEGWRRAGVGVWGEWGKGVKIQLLMYRGSATAASPVLD